MNITNARAYLQFTTKYMSAEDIHILKQNESNGKESMSRWSRFNNHVTVINTKMMLYSLMPLTVIRYYYEGRGGKLPTLFSIYWKGLRFKGIFLPIKDYIRYKIIKYYNSASKQSIGVQLSNNFISAAISTIFVNILHTNLRQDAFTRMMSAVTDAMKLKKYYKDYDKSMLLYWRDLLKMYNSGAIMRIFGNALAYGLTFSIFDTIQPLMPAYLKYLILPNVLLGYVLSLTTIFMVNPIYQLSILKRKAKVVKNWDTNFLVEYKPYSALLKDLKPLDIWMNIFRTQNTMKYHNVNAVQFGLIVSFYQCLKQYMSTNDEKGNIA